MLKLNATQTKIIECLSCQPGCTVRQIANATGIKPATLSNNVRALELAGYVLRGSLKGDSLKLYLNGIV